MIKNDVWLILCMLLVAGVFFVYFGFLGAEEGSKVVIRVDQRIEKELPLQEEQTIEVKGIYGTNVVHILDGTVRMVSAECPDQLCVLQGSISRPAESIVCLPNRMVIEIVGDSEKELDAIAR